MPVVKTCSTSLLGELHYNVIKDIDNGSQQISFSYLRFSTAWSYICFMSLCIGIAISWRLMNKKEKPVDLIWYAFVVTLSAFLLISTYICCKSMPQCLFFSQLINEEYKNKHGACHSPLTHVRNLPYMGHAWWVFPFIR